MTDITNQEKRTAIEVSEAIERGDYPMADMWPIMARVILATVEAPEPTLSEELRYRADLLDNGDPDGDTANVLRTLATDAAQMEHDLTEVRAKVDYLKRDLAEAYETRDARDDEVDRLRADVARLTAVQKGAESNAESLDPADVPAPRVITNPDELDRLPHSSVILSADNDAWQKSSEISLWASAWWTTSDGEPSMWPSDCLCDEDHPATVLWEQEA